MSLAFTPNFYLSQVGDDLVLLKGYSSQGAATDQPRKRILVIGGGVTGFTVGLPSFYSFKVSDPFSRLLGRF